MTEGKGYCHRRLRRIKQEQLQKDLEDLDKGKIVAITNQRKREVKGTPKEDS
ncbi:MAG: hypothetical protein PVF15_08980 [Candidatus Bathyarchaeota archaeon]|jgi:hypothetical protein